MTYCNHEKFMAIALELAAKGFGKVSPNPMVGAVLVSQDGEIIGRGWHKKAGEEHAEVNAINDCSDGEALKSATIYVTLEPCSHYGKTPPCADLIIEKGIKNVVVACLDPFKLVAGRGIEKLRSAGINVTVGVLEAQARELNKRFLTYVERQRPYIILKWAQSADGAIDIVRTDNVKPAWLTGEDARKKVHEWRAQEDAIMVGRKTAQKDNPSLTVRAVDGKNPIRVVVDRNLQLPQSLNIFTDNQAKTLLFTDFKTEVLNFDARKMDKQNGGIFIPKFENTDHKIDNKFNKNIDKNIDKNSVQIAVNQQQTEIIKIDFSQNILPKILGELHSRKVESLIVEGGTVMLQSFIDQNLWDEARIFTTKYPISHHYPYISDPQPLIAPKIAGEVGYSDDILKIITPHRF